MRFARPLSDNEVRTLEHMRRNEVGRVSQSAHMVLLSNRRFCVVRISRIFGTREATVRRWIERFEQNGIDCLCDRPRSGRPLKVEAAVLQRPNGIVMKGDFPTSFSSSGPCTLLPFRPNNTSSSAMTLGSVLWIWSISGAFPNELSLVLQNRLLNCRLC